jgi:transposase-like protein
MRHEGRGENFLTLCKLVHESVGRVKACNHKPENWRGLCALARAMERRISLNKRMRCPQIRCRDASQALLRVDSHALRSPKPGSRVRSSIIRQGYYWRKDDGKWIPRFRCRVCGHSFSSARFLPNYRQKKRTLNQAVFELHCSVVSERRIARLLRINRKTVVRKSLFMTKLAKAERLEDQRKESAKPESQKIQRVQFDEMRSSVWSKCLPVSILIAVSEKRKILSFRVAEIPANGPLAEISRKKYGFRRDERNEKAGELLTEIAPLLSQDVNFLTDKDSMYPGWIRSHFPHATHNRVKGRRGRSDGQGELKVGGFDPLFPLNHSCAMIRANVNRLLRRTWCTSKRKERLEAHLELYVKYHNSVLVPNPSV